MAKKQGNFGNDYWSRNNNVCAMPEGKDSHDRYWNLRAICICADDNKQ